MSAERTIGAKGSGVPVAWRGLVEVQVGEGLGIGRVEGGRLPSASASRLIEVELGLRGSASGGEGRRPVWKSEMVEDGLDGGRVGDERENPHFTTAGRAQKWEHLATNASRRCPRARSEAQEMRAEPLVPDGSGTGVEAGFAVVPHGPLAGRARSGSSSIGPPPPGAPRPGPPRAHHGRHPAAL
jgi:hypothetical protein